MRKRCKLLGWGADTIRFIVGRRNNASNILTIEKAYAQSREISKILVGMDSLIVMESEEEGVFCLATTPLTDLDITLVKYKGETFKIPKVPSFNGIYLLYKLPYGIRESASDYALTKREMGLLMKDYLSFS